MTSGLLSDIQNMLQPLNEFLNKNAFITLLAGAIIPPLGWLVVHFLRYIRLLLKRSSIVGHWYEYHWSFVDGTAQLRKETWKIRKAFRSGYVVHAACVTDGLGEHLSYDGTLTVERDHWLVTFTSNNHDEVVFCRLTRPLRRKNQIIVGLQSCLDFNGRASVGPLVLSDQQLTDAEAIKTINDRVEIDPTAKLMRIMDMVRIPVSKHGSINSR